MLMQNRRWSDIIVPCAKNNIICIFMLLVLWNDVFFCNQTENINQSGSFFIDKILTLTGLSQSIGSIVNFIIFAAVSFFILRMNDVFLFIKTRTVLPTIFFVISGSLLLPHEFTSAAFVTTLLLLAINSACKMCVTERIHFAFNAGMLLALASLVYPFAIILVLPFWSFALSFNMLSLRTILATIIGIFVPILYGLMWLFFIDGKLLFPIDTNLEFQYFLPDNILKTVLLGVNAVILLISIINLITTNSQENIRPQRMFSFFLSSLTFSLAISLFAPGGLVNLSGIIIVLASIIIGRFFTLNYAYSRIVKILLWIYLAVSSAYFILNLASTNV